MAGAAGIEGGASEEDGAAADDGLAESMMSKKLWVRKRSLVALFAFWVVQSADRATGSRRSQRLMSNGVALTETVPLAKAFNLGAPLASV